MFFYPCVTLRWAGHIWWANASQTGDKHSDVMFIWHLFVKQVNTDVLSVTKYRFVMERSNANKWFLVQYFQLFAVKYGVGHIKKVLSLFSLILWWRNLLTHTVEHGRTTANLPYPIISQLVATLRWLTAGGAIRIAVQQLSQTWKLRHYDVMTRKIRKNGDHIAAWNRLSYPMVKTASLYDNFCKTGNCVIDDVTI